MSEVEYMFEVPEVVLNDDIGDGVKDELDVVGVRGAREVRVHFFRLSAFVEVFELFLNIGRCFVVCVHACARAVYVLVN